VTSDPTATSVLCCVLSLLLSHLSSFTLAVSASPAQVPCICTKLISIAEDTGPKLLPTHSINELPSVCHWLLLVAIKTIDGGAKNIFGTAGKLAPT